MVRTPAMRADRRDGGEPPADLRLHLGRHQIAAVRVGADGQGLGFQRPQAARFAAAHVNLERGLMLERGRAARLPALAAERGPRVLQRDLVEPAPLRVDGGVDAGELFLQHDVTVALVEPLVVGLLEGLEGAHHLGVRHHRVLRNAGLGLQIVGSVDIH